MQPHADRVHERWSFTGPLLDPGRLDPAAWTPPAGGRPRSRRAADAEALRAAVTTVADDAEVRARLGALQAEVRASGSPAHAADLVEAELGAGIR
jgi:hypothetical protein